MKILSAEEKKSVIVETDKKEFPWYRRNSEGSWENFMGESWEPVWWEEELEQAYQEWLRK